MVLAGVKAKPVCLKWAISARFFLRPRFNCRVNVQTANNDILSVTLAPSPQEKWVCIILYDYRWYNLLTSLIIDQWTTITRVHKVMQTKSIKWFVWRWFSNGSELNCVALSHGLIWSLITNVAGKIVGVTSVLVFSLSTRKCVVVTLSPRVFLSFSRL
jgi:hypothetical protein